nr:protein root UVB sensitive 6 [Ipomoea batatas]
MKLKPPSNSASQTLTATTSSHDARLLVRETLRISANLASAPPSSVPTEPLLLDTSSRLLCCEEIDGRMWKYFPDGSVSCGAMQPKKKSSIRAVGLHSPQTPIDVSFLPLRDLMAFVRSYVVPEGFPDSVMPSYVPYMSWRALKYFCGGAMSVFTTQTLLGSVGVSKNRATQSAVAINWILKDGAGRVGKMLFARQGKKFDYDLKQLRFTGDLLMQLGAAVELATSAFPQLFLPLACAANVAKNVAAVTSTSTRTPIYKAFAKGENIGDVTAKGECVANLADLLGTGMSIMISKRNPSLVTTFSLLSFGYLFSSYQEVKSVVLCTLNRARFTVAVESFLKTGGVPTLKEGNSMEKVCNFPWKNQRPIILGPRFKEAFQDPDSYLAVKPIFEREQYIVTYNPSKRNVYALLKNQAKSDDVLKAAFHAHILLHFINSSNYQSSSGKEMQGDLSFSLASSADLHAHVAESYKMVSALYAPFKSKAKEQVRETLNPWVFFGIVFYFLFF